MSSCVSDAYLCCTRVHFNISNQPYGWELIMAAMCTCSVMSIFLLGKTISFMSVSKSATLFSRPQYAIVMKIFYSGMCTQLCKYNLLLYWSNLGTSKILFHNCVASDIRIIIKLLSCVSDAYLCRTIFTILVKFR